MLQHDGGNSVYKIGAEKQQWTPIALTWKRGWGRVMIMNGDDDEGKEKSSASYGHVA